MATLVENTKFLLSFLRHPVAVGSIVPSSKWLADRMVADMGLGEAETVVELGPGLGSCTEAILKHIGPATLLLAVELNREFAEKLTAKYPRARVINDSAEHVREHLGKLGRDRADSILSSLPWAGFTPELQERLLNAIVDTLRPGGHFATYAYIHCAWLPNARRFRESLESRFRSVRTTRVVWRNIPPAFVYKCEK